MKTSPQKLRDYAALITAAGSSKATNDIGRLLRAAADDIEQLQAEVEMRTTAAAEMADGSADCYLVVGDQRFKIECFQPVPITIDDLDDRKRQ